MAPPTTFGELLERHERDLYAYALRLTGQRSDADDLFQETFLAAFRAWPPPRSDQLRAWLYKIATTKMVDRVRKTRHVVSLNDLRLVAPDGNSALRTDLAAAIRTLPPGQRAAFMLREVEGLTYREVGAALGCAQDAARGQVSQARKKLRQALR
ncbi:MAG: sigma-70 family RNA polymerase sigma factor [Chloroflexi bacterium]|nr:sigma-70 family RNA polymerase sigma factor [Chloroflexota bacterium]